MKFLSRLAGQNTLNDFKEGNMEDFFEICRSFEAKKKTILPDKDGATNMSLPQSYFKYFMKRHKVNDFNEVIQKCLSYKDKVTSGLGKIKMQKQHFRDFFEETVKNILKYIEDLFQEELVCDVGTILMVGGFSECKIVQHAVRERFNGKKVVIPEEAGLAVLNGAVYFGHIPQAISRRSARYTYGIQTWAPFDRSSHPVSKKTVSDGRTRCRDVFFKFVQKGERIYPGYSKSQIFTTLQTMDKLNCHVYISDNPSPVFTDEEGCRRLGTLKIPLTEAESRSRREIEETMIFGETELKVRAEDLFTGTVKEVIFDLLQE